MSTAANPSAGALPVDGTTELGDPFISSPTHDISRHRYSGLDAQYTSLYSNGSPAQAKRALEAYMAETERRLQEASRLGAVLLKQKKDLGDRLNEVNAYEQEDEVTPELRQKLQELEKEVNDISRETTRAFLAKSRIPSAESSDLSVLSSDAQASPSKIHPPSSRKQRNQPQGRMNDIKLATEISTSLLNQIRDLQAAYAEKDEALKAATDSQSKLELDIQGLKQKVRAMDESEQRYKDENWDLERQLHDLTASQKEAVDREQRLAQHLNVARSEKATVLRDFEELKQAHGKLNEDHVAIRKQHEAELSSLKRDNSLNESERDDMQRKIEELTSQNKELAKAVHYRLTSGQFAAPAEQYDDDEDIADGRITPDNSPPGSPTKATPRHGGLESETLKSSLHHAQRMIQNLKNNIHREKTEKLELKRLLQDARDELESRRGQGGADSGKKRKTNKEQDLLKKSVQLSKLGVARNSREDIILNDPDWEDHDEAETPSKPRAVVLPMADAATGVEQSSSNYGTDAYATATEHSDAFETANERESATDTDAFHTGVETLDGDSTDDLTETEDGPSKQSAISKKRSANRLSFQSTASTSGDEYDLTPSTIRTPTQADQPRYKIKVNRGSFRKSSARPESLLSSSPAYRDSPASVTSATSNGSAAPAGQSLFAELGNLSDVETEPSTPRSTNMLSPGSSPELIRKSPAPSSLRNTTSAEEKPAMVDAGTMTEQVEQQKGLLWSAPAMLGAAIAGGIGFGLSHGSNAGHANASGVQEESEPTTAVELRPESTLLGEYWTNADQTTADSKAAPNKLSGPGLALSPITTQHTTPVKATPEPAIELAEPEPPTLAFSSVMSEHTEPVAALPKEPEPKVEVPPVALTMAPMTFEATEPVDPPRPSTAKRISQISQTENSHAPTPTKASSGFFGNVFKRNRSSKDVSTTIVAEDATAQPMLTPTDPNKELTPVKDDRRPFQPVEPNAIPSSVEKPRALSPKKRSYESTTEGTQTLLSAEELDRLMKPKVATNSIGTDAKPIVLSPTTPVFGNLSPRRGREVAAEKARRPGSAGSLRSRTSTPPPPLPSEAMEAIAAAQSKAPGAVPAAPGLMGPPTMPASAYNRNSLTYRPRTPVRESVTSPTKGQSTIKAPMNTYQPSRSGAASPATTRRSSVSSFASELDHRFNISRSATEMNGFDMAGTDPRMIQAITQTMIGEFLWKYTRKPGREGISSTRHRRFFWVHPYTRTLYWSEQDPSTAGRAQLKAKSVAIEAVRVVSDDNPSPPGLHRKSLVVITPGRTIKFTAPTGQRHETWFNALSYLLLRTNTEREENVDGVTVEEVEEFNPSWRSSSRMTGRSKASLSSYASRVTMRTASPIRHQHPTLVPKQSIIAQRASTQRSQSAAPAPSGSISRRLSSISSAFRSSSVVRRYSTTPGEMEVADTTSSVTAHDSAEDLRAVIEAQEREADRLENVRACCDGKLHSIITRRL